MLPKFRSIHVHPKKQSAHGFTENVNIAEQEQTRNDKLLYLSHLSLIKSESRLLFSYILEQIDFNFVRFSLDSPFTSVDPLVFFLPTKISNDNGCGDCLLSVGKIKVA